MDFNIPPIGGVERTGPAPRSAPAQEAGFSAALDAAVNVSTLPASPPLQCSRTCTWQHACSRSSRAQKRELHFEATGNGRVVVQVRDLDGNVIRTIPPAKALAVASGEPLEV